MTIKHKEVCPEGVYICFRDDLSTQEKLDQLPSNVGKFAGSTVSQIRKHLEIPANAPAFVNEQPTKETYRLRAGDYLQFEKL